MQKNKSAKVLQLIERGASPSAAPSGCFSRGRTPLYFAIERRLLDMVTLLLDYGADVNGLCCKSSWQGDGRRTERGGLTPVALCIKIAAPDLLQILLARGADPNSFFKTANGRFYPLPYAVRYAKLNNSYEAVECLKVLLKHGADPSRPVEHYVSTLSQGTDSSVQRVYNTYTPVEYAGYFGLPEVAGLIKRHLTIRD